MIPQCELRAVLLDHDWLTLITITAWNLITATITTSKKIQYIYYKKKEGFSCNSFYIVERGQIFSEIRTAYVEPYHTKDKFATT